MSLRGQAHCVTSYWHSDGTVPESVGTISQFSFHGKSSDVEKLLLYFGSNAGRGRLEVKKASNLLGCQSGYTFNFYYSKLSADSAITEDGRSSSAPKHALIEQCKSEQSPEKTIHLAISSSLKALKLTNSLSVIENLYHIVGFNVEAKYGLLQKLFLKHTDFQDL